MTSTLSKRHQARNERALQDLIKTVPGNDRCAECGARNPGWASWSLGVFLCMRCAALHRKLGTHISKVKSLSMDSWSNEQVDNMKSRGNTTSNHIYNPKNTQPAVPLDVDEVDSAMERFIRQKYDQQVLSGGKPSRAPTARAPIQHNTGSSDEQLPQPPPKGGRRFGFGLRSTSSALPLARSSQHSPSSPSYNFDMPKKHSRVPSPIRINKQSRVFGASIGLTEEGMDWKLVTLKEMGFPDDKRNSNVLKGLGGDLERAIESLVRLGEGTTPGSRNRTPTSAKFPDVVNRVVSKATTGNVPPTSSGLNSAPLQRPSTSHTQTQNQTAKLATPSSSSVQSYNPFENIAPPLISAPLQQQQNLQSAFQSMNMSQPLFPNNTGGHLNQHQPSEQVRMQQSMTPPVPQLPQQFMQSNPYAQQHMQHYNPFLASPQQQQPQPASINPYWTPQESTEPQNIYQSQTSLNSVLSQPFQTPYPQPQQQWTQIAQQPYQESPQQMFSPQSFTQPLQSPPYIQSQNYPSHLHTMPQPLIPQQTGRYDKSSIMALYNYPQLAPPPLMQDFSGSNATSSAPSPQPPAAKLPPGVLGLAQRSATMPTMLSSGSKNPFLNSGAAMGPTNTAQVNSGSRQSSIDNGHSPSGRHSPDAFASLSARFVR
ncbi:hypothetical protein MMC13_006644 [Lambiella insularis]|nr:hypothetical protein [Lambiella insularis]